MLTKLIRYCDLDSLPNFTAKLIRYCDLDSLPNVIKINSLLWLGFLTKFQAKLIRYCDWDSLPFLISRFQMESPGNPESKCIKLSVAGGLRAPPVEQLGVFSWAARCGWLLTRADAIKQAPKLPSRSTSRAFQGILSLCVLKMFSSTQRPKHLGKKPRFPPP